MSEQALPGRSILNRAREIVHGARQRDLYGAPERNLDRFARVVSVILGHPVTPYQAGLILAGLKLVRASTNADKPDRSSLEDMAGYAELCALLPDPAVSAPGLESTEDDSGWLKVAITGTVSDPPTETFVADHPIKLTNGDVAYLRRQGYLDHTTAQENGLA